MFLVTDGHESIIGFSNYGLDIFQQFLPSSLVEKENMDPVISCESDTRREMESVPDLRRQTNTIIQIWKSGIGLWLMKFGGLAWIAWLKV